MREKIKAAKEINEVSILNMAKYLSKDQRVIYPNTNSGYGISENKKYVMKIHRSIQYHFTV